MVKKQNNDNSKILANQGKTECFAKASKIGPSQYMAIAMSVLARLADF